MHEKIMTEFRRNSEFDRVYWDDYSDRRWETSQRSSQQTVIGPIPRFSPTRATVQKSPSISNNATSDSVSTVFLYPFSDNSTSMSRSLYTLENSAASFKGDCDKRFHIKRSEYSEYNEQRIKFHLKFYLILILGHLQ